MSDCNLIANCDGTGDGGCFIDCCDITCPPENPCEEIKIKYYCQPIGACCYPTNQDCSRTTQCQCESNGGQYQGDGSKCEPDNPCVKCVPPCDPNLCLECIEVRDPDTDALLRYECKSYCNLGQTGNCINYSVGPEYNYIPTGLVPTTIQTITVPGQFTLPVLLTFSNGCDDGFVIDGVRVSSFAQTPPPMLINNSTFQIGVWNDGGPWVGNVSLCFSNPDVCCYGNCCPTGSVCCNDGTCCAQNQTCCNNPKTGVYTCCDPGRTCCFGNCCPIDKPECCGDGTCCSAGQTCCLDEGTGTYTCCNPGETCCGGICCPAGQNCCTESTTSPPYCSPNPCPIPGCMYPGSPSYNPAATCDNGSCRTCCNAGLCVVDDRDAGANCNPVGNGCCDTFCLTANDCSPTFITGSGQLPSCDRDLNGDPFINEYPACLESNDCIQGYLNPDILEELEKNIENYNNYQTFIYDESKNEVFDQNNSPTYYQEIKEYDFSALTSCACTCPQSFKYQGLSLNYGNDLKAMNSACSEYTITITTDYECGLTGGTTVSLAPCCCDGNFDTNTYTVSASSSGDCLEFTWDNTNIKTGQSRTISIITGEDCECVYCGTECVPFSTPFIKKLEGNVIKVSLDKKEIQKRLNFIRKKIIKKRKN